MQVPGKILVLATFAVGLALAAGAWWFNYLQSYRAAQFWRGGDAGLIVGGPVVTLFELGDAGSDGVLGRAVIRKYSLTDKPGLAHLRHALTYDANFDWGQRRVESFGTSEDGPHNLHFAVDDWPYALEFARGDRKAVVLFPRKFNELGRPLDSDAGPKIDVLPCPHLGPVILRYLGEIGVKLEGEQARAGLDAR
jgi:hypothetical protein